MGFSCSPVMCNLYFAYLEYKFVVSLAEKCDVELLQCIKHCYRYMDDILCVNFPGFSEISKQIYPLDIISIEPTLIECVIDNSRTFVTKTVYLNLEISLISPYVGEYSIKYTWKREKLPIIPDEFVKKTVTGLIFRLEIQFLVGFILSCILQRMPFWCVRR